MARRIYPPKYTLINGLESLSAAHHASAYAPILLIPMRPRKARELLFSCVDDVMYLSGMRLVLGSLTPSSLTLHPGMNKIINYCVKFVAVIEKMVNLNPG